LVIRMEGFSDQELREIRPSGRVCIREEIKRKFKDINQGYIALILAPAMKYQKVNVELIRYMIKERGIPGVYVTINKPFSTMKAILEKEKIDTEAIIFIDAITQTTRGKVEKGDNCRYITSPENLTDISVAITEAAQAIPLEKKFVFFDSLSTLLLYNNFATVARFSHFLTGKLRAWNVEGILMSIEQEADESLLTHLSQFCDSVIELGKG